jgi:hypothetical protein
MYLLITRDEWIWFAAMIISTGAACFFFGSGLGFLAGLDIVSKAKPVNSPETPKNKMYLDIVSEIKKANNASDLYAAYVNLLIFETEYSKSEAWLVSMLYEMYELKEIELNTLREPNPSL